MRARISFFALRTSFGRLTARAEFDVRTGKGINPGNSQLVVFETRVTDSNIEVLLPEDESPPDLSGGPAA